MSRRRNDPFHHTSRPGDPHAGASARPPARPGPPRQFREHPHPIAVYGPDGPPRVYATLAAYVAGEPR